MPHSFSLPSVCVHVHVYIRESGIKTERLKKETEDLEGCLERNRIKREGGSKERRKWRGPSGARVRWL